MNEKDDREHLALLLQVATRYYLDNLSQVDIAREIRFSRATVSRLLAEARQRGVVRFQVEHPLGRVLELEAELCRQFGLRQARIVDPSNSPSALQQLARCAAELVLQTIRPDSVIAVSNGRTLAAVVDELPKRRYNDVYAVQMIGGLGKQNPMVDSPELCRKVAESLGGRYQGMPVPLIVETPELAAAMRREPAIATALALASHADVALVGIGTTDQYGSGQIFEGWMTPEISAELWRAGAVGHIAGHHFDAYGRHLESSLCQRLISIRIEKLTDIGEVLAVAFGPEKGPAILGALRGGFLSSLVTDVNTARRVLALSGTAAVAENSLNQPIR